MTAASNSEARKRAQEHVPLAVLLVDAIDTKWTRPEHACDGTEQSCTENCPRPAYERMGLDDLRDDAVVAVERIVRDHTDRALAEVEQRIDQCGVRTDSAERWGIITALHIVRDFRAARQEQGR